MVALSAGTPTTIHCEVWVAGSAVAGTASGKPSNTAPSRTATVLVRVTAPIVTGIRGQPGLRNPIVTGPTDAEKAGPLHDSFTCEYQIRSATATTSSDIAVARR